MDGSIYGEGIYSVALYSWEVGWIPEFCDSLTRSQAYVAPPSVAWSGVAFQPLTVRSSYVTPPVAGWLPVADTPLTVR